MSEADIADVSLLRVFEVLNRPSRRLTWRCSTSTRWTRRRRTCTTRRTSTRTLESSPTSPKDVRSLSLSSLPTLAQIMSMADRQALWRATAPAAKQVVDQCFGEYYIMYSTQLYNTEQDFA